MRFNLARPLRDLICPSVALKGLWVSKNLMLSTAGCYTGLAIFVIFCNQTKFFDLNCIFLFKLDFLIQNVLHLYWKLDIFLQKREPNE